MTRINDIRSKIKDLDKEYEKSFEQFIKDGLYQEELMSYAPNVDESKEELQKAFIKNAIQEYENHKKWCRKQIKELSIQLNEIHALQHVLNEILKADIDPTPRTVFKQTEILFYGDLSP